MGFQAMHSADGKVRQWLRYPHTFRVFRQINDGGWLAAYHHNTIPVMISVTWVGWVLYVAVLRNGRQMANLAL